jgi:PAS domain S-box-containing protein
MPWRSAPLSAEPRFAPGEERALAPSEEITLSHELEVVYRTALDGLFLVDDERRYLLVNEPAAQILGASVKEVVGRRIEDFTPPDLVAVIKQRWEELEREGRREGRFEILRADGVRVTVEYRATWNFAPGQHLVAVREVSTGAGPSAGMVGTPGTPALTAREREVLQLTAEGHSNRQIAEVLFVSSATVKTHLEHIYEKLGVRDRVAAVARSLRRGLID